MYQFKYTLTPLICCCYYYYSVSVSKKSKPLDVW